MSETAIIVKEVSKKYRLFDSAQDRLKEALHPFSKHYHREFWALRGISFEIPRGQTVGILGRNGSGKSTLLQIIAGIMQPTSGEVIVNGRISALLELGAGFNPEFTGRENAIFQAEVMGLRRDEIDRKLPEIEEFADIGEFFDQPVKVYSSGMFVRAAFATAISVDPDILIVDDPMTPLQAASIAKRTRVIEWFEQTFSTRLNDKKKGVIVVIMQRLHVDDLSGHLLRKKFWQTLILPAVSEQDTMFEVGKFTHLYKTGDLLNPKREGEKEIEMAKLELGSYGFNAQYQQSPLHLTNGIVKSAWIKSYIDLPTHFDLCYQSWDCALSTKTQADYSVCSTWGIVNQQIYLLDIFRKQIDFISLKQMVIKLYENYKPAAVIIENKASGQSLIQELAHTTLIPVIKYLPTNDKMSRLLMVCSMFESGKVLFPQNASWLAELESELFHFPNAAHDDQVDSATQFLLWFKNNAGHRYMVRAV